MAHQNHHENNRPDLEPSQSVAPLAPSHGGRSEQNMPAEESHHGPLESAGVHEQTQGLNAADLRNCNPSHHLSSATSLTSNSRNSATPPNPSVSSEISAQQVNPAGPNVTSMPSDSYTINMPMTPSESSPHEDNNLVFIVFAVELLGALTNQVVSSKPDNNQVLIYVVVACSTLAFSISSAALALHKKRPRIAKKMQKAAFLIGTFGFMGIMGMLLPSTITWYFTISAFLVYVLMFALASSIQ